MSGFQKAQIQIRPEVLSSVELGPNSFQRISLLDYEIATSLE